MTHTLATLCPLGIAGWRAAMEEAAGLAQGAHVRALTRPDHAEEILHHLVQRLLDRMAFAETVAARAAQEDARDDQAYRAWVATTSGRIASIAQEETTRALADISAARAEAAQEGLADAVAAAGTPQAKRRVHPNQKGALVWTEERIALARAQAAKVPSAELFKALNALPGPPIASPDSMRFKLKRLGLEVTPGAENLPAPTTAEGRAAAKRERCRLAIVAAGGGDWTAERLALLDAEFASAPNHATLLARINALPGNPIASASSMTAKARSRRLKRPRRPLDPQHLARMNAARLGNRAAAPPPAEPDPQAPSEAPAEAATVKQPLQVAPPEPEREAAPEPVATPEPSTLPPLPAAPMAPSPTIKPDVKVPPAPAPRSAQRVTTPWIKEAMEGKRPIAAVAATLDAWASPGVLTEDAEIEALRLLAEGQGAKALHEEFGGRLEWWQSWTARYRQAGRAA
jgi:hypothetical protein